MIILDTNTISEPTKPTPDQRVMGWMGGQALETLFLTATSLAEIHIGVESLPKGKRKDILRADTAKLLDRAFGPRILPFDEAAAVAYGSLIKNLRSKGYTLSFADGQIASIALVHGFAVATRDTGPFLAAGLKVINPWEAV
jgi:predicted nucleic acid-binding protein